MTGNVDPMSVEAFKRCGFDGLVAKPYTQQDVEQLIVRTGALLASPVARGAPREFWSTLTNGGGGGGGGDGGGGGGGGGVATSVVA